VWVRVAHLFRFFVLSYYVYLRSEFRLYSQLFVGGFIS
jgi:hypothetical protein